MRQLTKEEKAINLKSVYRLANRNKQLEDYYIPKTELELNEGLMISFVKTKAELQAAISEWKEEVNRNYEQIKILKDQNKLGVEPKKKPSGVE